MSDTPITDANVCITTKEGCETIAPDICRKFERENAAMREAMKEAASAFKMLSDVEPETFAEQLSVGAVCHVEFSKLQPFLKP